METSTPCERHSRYHWYPQARTVDIPLGAANFRAFAYLIKAYPNEAIRENYHREPTVSSFIGSHV